MNQDPLRVEQPHKSFSMPFRAGEVIGGKYEVQRLLGTGGIGFVISARHLELGESVALKFLRPELLGNREVVHRFASEARTTARIKSEHVARVFDVGTLASGVPFLVMELLEGKDLSQLLHDQWALPSERAVEYVLEACEALATAHANGIVHRDIKPENLFLAKRVQGPDVIKVLDFGISKVSLPAADHQHRFAQTTMAIGSPPYMSPEQVRGSAAIDGRADIWSLGCVLYELLTGRPAFDATSVMQVCAAVLEKDPPPLCALQPTVDRRLEVVVLRCLEKDPARRYQSVGELATALCPFAPARARVWAERSSHALRDGSPDIDIDVSPLSTNNPVSISQLELPPFRRTMRPRRALAALAIAAAIPAGYALGGRVNWTKSPSVGTVSSTSPENPAAIAPTPATPTAPAIDMTVPDAPKAAGLAIAPPATAPVLPKSRPGSVVHGRPKEKGVTRDEPVRTDEPDVGF